jgi:hypothetical protein
MTESMEEAEEKAKLSGLKTSFEMNNPRWGRYLKTRFYVDAFEYCSEDDQNHLVAAVADHSSWFDSWPGVSSVPHEERPLKITYGDDTEFTEDELRWFVEVYDRHGI